MMIPIKRVEIFFIGVACWFIKALVNDKRLTLAFKANEITKL